MIVVGDTSPLSNLAVVGHLFVLQRLYNTIIIPQAVADELMDANAVDSQISAILQLDWIATRLVEDTEMVEMLQRD